MMSSERDCFGYPFSPDKKRCVGHEEMPDCEPQSYDKTKSPHIPGFDFHCVDPNTAGGCEHCYLGYKCIEGKAHVNLCEDFDKSCTDEVFDGDCIPNIASQARDACIPKGVDIYIDYFNVTYYHFCDINMKYRETYTCEDGTYFNVDSEKCEQETSPPVCNGYSPPVVNPDNCQHYYSCRPDGTLMEGNCQSLHYFNETSKTCEPICNIKAEIENNPPDDLCPESNTFDIDPQDCTIYYLCFGNPPDAVQQKCNDGEYFSPDDEKCVPGPLPEDCKKFDYSKCPGYNDISCE